MSFDAVAALLTTLVATALTGSMAGQYLAKHRTHALWWGLSFLFAAAASFLQFLALAQGAWHPGAYRLYVVVSAAVPALMGAGSMYLLWRRLALPYLVVILAFGLLVLDGALFAPLQEAQLTSVLHASQQVTAVLPSTVVTLGFAVLGAFGGAALVVGALWSWFKSRRPFNLGIAAGAIVFSLGDTLSALGIPALFYASEIAGIVALYLAVRAAHSPQPRREAAVAPD